MNKFIKFLTGIIAGTSLLGALNQPALAVSNENLTSLISKLKKEGKEETFNPMNTNLKGMMYSFEKYNLFELDDKTYNVCSSIYYNCSECSDDFEEVRYILIGKTLGACEVYIIRDGGPFGRMDGIPDRIVRLKVPLTELENLNAEKLQNLEDPADEQSKKDYDKITNYLLGNSN